ncbi:LysR family transcriptional regulator [Mesorhizobium sp. VK23B]|uniref:LysR family transcriptional regulator n=1 Tax=Mesorhizobium dulcispinae TaxID=3072316 RepID=A0ABU4XPJ6_9HYPH|nr:MULTISPECIES: LysR family transcriptional regulator [unclassified Mesorhizobium]MDX8470271.1 LysR family transcriptional regulator [Mesorhizobium sp. VK23B]MDX8476674.1 LysR family transcriptional regulator [Mesorhizobium sp. VK23A]
MSDKLSALRLFTRVARTGSFSRAARELDLSQPTASRIIALLEQELGTTLVTRTTRAVSLTDAGIAYLERIQPILDALDEAEHMVRGGGEIRGALRVGASSSFASRAIVPRLGVFIDSHPALRVELLIDDRRQDLIGEGVDVAIRTGKLTDSSAVAKKVGSWPLVLVAAPDYLARKGTPAHPDELAEHSLIVGGPLGTTWTFTRNGSEIPVKVFGHLVVSASEVAVNAAVAGLGLAVGTILSFHHHIEAGRLVRLLPQWQLGELDIHALYPSGQTPKPAAKLFTDFLIQELRSLFKLPS